MKKRLPLLIAVALCASLVTARAVTKADDTKAAYKAPGTEFATALSTLTGVAISPLLGTSAYGAVKWFQAKTPERRARLPWFAQPWFWVPALLLVGACFVKDTAGTVLPTVLKKPFDVAETVEHKISGLVATGAFVPFIVAALNDRPAASALFSSLGFAAADLSWLYDILMTPLAMIAFFIVFMASNAINILIILSPFTTVDAALKTFRTTVLGTVVVSAWVNPWIGAAWALVIIVISYFIAGWSFRLSFFGLVFVWDTLTFRRKRFTPDETVNWMFLGRKINKAPARTYGKLSRDEKGGLVLKYRPWLVLPERTMTLPEGKYAVGKGLIYSEIRRLEGDETRTALLLPPRYRSHENELVTLYGLTDVRPVGLRAAWKWLKELFGFKPKAQPAAA
jgi:hypothetical protein